MVVVVVGGRCSFLARLGLAGKGKGKSKLERPELLAPESKWGTEKTDLEARPLLMGTLLNCTRRMAILSFFASTPHPWQWHFLSEIPLLCFRALHCGARFSGTCWIL